MPLPAVAFLHPADGRDGNAVLDQPLDHFPPGLDLLHHQWDLIHANTPCFLSVMAWYSPSASAFVIRSYRLDSVSPHQPSPPITQPRRYLTGRVAALLPSSVCAVVYPAVASATRG